MWKSHIHAGAEAYQLGDLSEAEKEFQAAVDVAEEFGPEDSRLAMSLDYLAAFYQDQGRLCGGRAIVQAVAGNRGKCGGAAPPICGEKSRYSREILL
jgi:hypothetical protein